MSYHRDPTLGERGPPVVGRLERTKNREFIGVTALKEDHRELEILIRELVYWDEGKNARLASIRQSPDGEEHEDLIYDVVCVAVSPTPEKRSQASWPVVFSEIQGVLSGQRGGGPRFSDATFDWPDARRRIAAILDSHGIPRECLRLP